MDLLRFTTAGSVDDGKSTLIGRLLYDSKSIFKDQYEALERASAAQGNGQVNLALLTDGLRAEREQGITIDVAYRYFATPRRKFIIADTPGHVQYTRNMVTGASTAELAVVLIDARKGVLQQSRRHGFIASLLQIPHMLVAINKMDLVDYSQEVYREIVQDYRKFSERIDIDDIVFIPISALEGDNVVAKSKRMEWYDGPTILHHLETVKVGADRNIVDFRFPVQYVVRPNQNFRGYAGQVASGSIAPGEDVTVLPSGQASCVESIVVMDAEIDEARAGDSIVVTLEDEVDVSRGDMIVRSRNQPQVARTLDADLCWMSEAPLRGDRPYYLQHTTRTVQAVIDKVIYRINIDSLHRESAETFELNDIGRVEMELADPLFVDAYKLNRETGAFVLIDPDTNATVAAGMIRGVSQNV
ncbi:MAG: sulfate adenylyltransferase subunit CysN, partial [Rhodothermales bacterium]